MTWEPGFSFKGRTYVARSSCGGRSCPPFKLVTTIPIDRFIDAYYVKKNVVPPDSVNDATFCAVFSST